jgi:hypothetical protein
MSKTKIPEQGFTLVDLMALAHERAVFMHIGVAGPDVGKIPAEVTVQFSSALKDNPMAFSFVLDGNNPHLNLGVSIQLLKKLDEFAPRRSKLIVL